MAKPDKILAHELLGREVLDLQAGEVVGSVVDFGINREGKVQLIGVLPSAWYSGGRGIAPAAITFLTGDRLCIVSGEALQDFSPDGESLISTDSGGQIYGKTVLLHDGEMLGELVDFRFNLGDGRITDLLVLDGEQRRSRVPIDKISTIGKDYIIIERASGSDAGEGSDSPDAGESSAGGEAAPFSGAAAAADAPAAAELPEPAVAVESPEQEPAGDPMPAVPARSGAGRGRGRGRGQAAPVHEPEPEPAAEPVSETEAAAPVAAPDDPPRQSADDAAEQSADVPQGNGTNLDAVFSLPAAGEPAGLLDGFQPAEAVPGNALAEQPEVDLFAQRGVSVSKFDEKKIEFLSGKAAHRDIKDPDGVIVLAEGETLDQSALVRIVEAGLLGEVFIEMTLRK